MGAGANFPISGNPAGAELLIGEVNREFGLQGAGSIPFWEMWAALVYRDTVAKGPTSGKGLRFPNGWYKLIATAGQRFERKADDDTRNLTAIAGKILLGPARAERVDGPAVPFDSVSPTADPEGDIEDAVKMSFKPWADLLPLTGATSVIVNGRASIDKNPDGTYKYPLLVPYTQRPYVDANQSADGLFSERHFINPLLGITSKTFKNLILLPGQVDESAWTATKDTMMQVPDLDGISLPNAFGLRPPLIMVPTATQWKRWAHVLGGPNVPRELIQQGDQAGIHSVFVGDAELMLNPYLLTLNDPANTTPITKRSFVFTRTGRKTLIYREELAPLVKDSGPDGAQSHTNNQRVLYIQARDTWILGEPRGVFEVREK